MEAPVPEQERVLVQSTFAAPLPQFEHAYESVGCSRLQARLVLQNEEEEEALEVLETVEKRWDQEAGALVTERRPGLLVVGEREMGACELENAILTLLAQSERALTNQEIRRRLHAPDSGGRL